MDNLPCRTLPAETQSCTASILGPPTSTENETIACTTSVPRLKLTRISKPKVRTGCVTCKKRHIKCDETKPWCTNCLKVSGHCEGYMIKPRKNKAKAKSTQNAASSQMTVQDAAATPTRLVEPDINSLDFSEDLSMVYFQEFVHLLRVSLGSGNIYGKLWKVTMPQLSRTNKTLRHAAIAIGALTKAHAYDLGLVPDIPKFHPAHHQAFLRLKEQSPHYHNAVAHYCQALRLQGQAVSDPSVLQVAICLSVLFICFEIIRGDRQSALRHINHGITLLHSLLTDDDAQEVASLAPNPKDFLADFVDTYAVLGVQSRTILTGRIGGSLPLPDLSRALMGQGKSLDSFLARIQHLEIKRGGPSLENMSMLFRDLDEAETCIMAIQYRASQMIPLVSKVVVDSGFFELDDESEVDDALEYVLRHPKIIAAYKECIHTCQSWSDAFQPLYRQCMMDEKTDQATYLRALHLRLHLLLIKAFSSLAQFTDINVMENLTPDYREINSLSEIILRMSQKDFMSSAHHVSLEGGLTWQLSMVSLQCREPLVREDAIRILTEYPRWHGLWDGRGFQAIAARNRRIEKTNMANGTPVQQWRRLWRREYIFEDAGNRVLFRFMDRDPVQEDKWVLVEEVADLTEGTDEIVWRRQPLTGSGKRMLAAIMLDGPSPNSRLGEPT